MDYSVTDARMEDAFALALTFRISPDSFFPSLDRCRNAASGGYLLGEDTIFRHLLDPVQMVHGYQIQSAIWDSTL